MRPPVFIIGNPRSGTTLLRLMLTNHQNIVIPPECGFAVWFYDKYRELVFSEKVIDLFVQDVLTARKIETWNLDEARLREYLIQSKVETYAQAVSAVYEFYGRSLGRTFYRWGDKNNFYLNYIPTIFAIFPSAQFIHIIRDGRDIACSYKTLGSSQIVSKYAPNLPVNIKKIASEWTDNIKKIRSSFEKLPSTQVYEIRYEDLVSQPERELTKICDFLREPYDSAMELYYIKNKLETQEPIEFLQWKAKTLEKPTSSEVGKYMQELKPEEIKEFEHISASVLNLYNYTLYT